MLAAPAFAPSGLTLPAVKALPTDGVLAAGQASASKSASRPTVTRPSDKAIANWGNFNFCSAAAVNFVQPQSTSAILNRVMGNDPSALLGTLTANSRVWLINPAGIMVGQGAKIDGAGFVASALNVRDENFLAGRLTFGANGTMAKVQNFGSIVTADGGNVYQVGTDVENHGLITSPAGEVVLAAGQSVALVDTATPGVMVEVAGAQGDFTNVGQVLGTAGRISMASALVSSSGVLNASIIEWQDGRIFVKAGQGIVTAASPAITANGTSGGSVI